VFLGSEEVQEGQREFIIELLTPQIRHMTS